MAAFEVTDGYDVDADADADAPGRVVHAGKPPSTFMFGSSYTGSTALLAGGSWWLGYKGRGGRGSVFFLPADPRLTLYMMASSWAV